jgi:hypothetical protein
MSAPSTLRRLWVQVFLARRSLGRRLLVDTMAQRKQFSREDASKVRGGISGKRYRIRRASSINVHELNEEGAVVACWCFVPDGYVPVEDVMLAQKLALELFEDGALAVARRYRHDAGQPIAARHRRAA